MKEIPPEVNAAIQNIAAKYGHLAEDMAAHVTLKMLEHMAEDATFAKQKPGYQRQWAKWTAAKYWRSITTYNLLVADEDALAVLTLDSEDVYHEFVCRGQPSPEEECLWNETLAAVQNALFQLPVVYERVARLLIDGYKPGEIAHKLAMSRSHVSHITRRMQGKMRQHVRVL